MSPRKGPRPEPNPRPIFQGLVIATTSFKGGEWNETNMSRWISLRKGRLSPQMDASVTHLICSEEDVKKKHPKVREAQKRGIKNCKLVTLDWLEDSMHAKRVLPEGDFSPQKALLLAKKIAARKKKVEKGFEQAVKTVNTNLYHHYQDHTYFTYVVTLRRDHVTPGERYVLFLEESNNSRPHLYWFFAKYYKKKSNTYAHVYRPSFTCGPFQREFDHFKNFFKTKTGIDWDERLVKEGMARDKKFFQYTSPTPSEAHVPGPEARYITSEEDAQRKEEYEKQRTAAACANNANSRAEAKPSTFLSANKPPPKKPPEKKNPKLRKSKSLPKTGGKPVGWVPPGSEKPDCPPAPNLDLEGQPLNLNTKEGEKKTQQQQEQHQEEEEPEEEPPTLEMLQDHLHTIETEAEEREAAEAETSSSPISSGSHRYIGTSSRRCSGGCCLSLSPSTDEDNYNHNAAVMEAVEVEMIDLTLGEGED